MVQSCVIVNRFGIKKKKKAGDATQIKINKHRISLFYTFISSYLDTMNGKETLLKMISQSGQACGCNRKMRVQCSHSLLAERVKSLDNVSAPSFKNQRVIFKEKEKKFVLIYLNKCHFYMHDHRIKQTALLFSFYNNFVKNKFQLQERLNKLNVSHTSFCGNTEINFLNNTKTTTRYSVLNTV